METSLHRQLKAHYALPGALQEVVLGDFRIDVVNPGCLVEVQHGSLAAIRDKIARLLKKHRVLVVKPIVARKRIIRLRKAGGPVVAARWSPKRGTLLNLFDELVYFTRVFPHENLTLEVPLVQVEERRFPGHGRRRWRRDSDFQVEDIRLVTLDDSRQFRTAADLHQLLPASLPSTFHTGHLAERLQVDRWIARRIAYCIRQTGSARQVGKQGNAILYQLTRAA
jgi:hypothetical protein